MQSLLKALFVRVLFSADSSGFQELRKELLDALQPFGRAANH
jgi:hypothetical protein